MPPQFNLHVTLRWSESDHGPSTPPYSSLTPWCLCVLFVNHVLKYSIITACDIYTDCPQTTQKRTFIISYFGNIPDTFFKKK